MTFCVVALSANRSWQSPDKSKAPTGAPVLVYLANSKATQAGRPRFMVCTYCGVEVAKDDKVIAAVDVLVGIVQVGLLPQVWRSRVGHRR